MRVWACPELHCCPTLVDSKMPLPSTDSSDAGSKNLLELLPDYGVVVCTACKFAVQPQALATHLLRHKIYRSDRVRILDHLSKCRLQEPENVTPPKSNEPPVAYLPVYRGLSCLASGCFHCCLSTKRMNKHWSEQHGEHESKNVRARSVSMQTFFRGTKIRYFEVDGSSVTHASCLRSSSISKLSQVLAQPTFSSSDISDSDLTLPAAVLDMPSLRYLHHYTISSHLKPRRCQTEPMSFWSETIPQEALACDFLMFAILGLSAIHLAATSLNLEDCRRHRNAAVTYQSAGISGFHCWVQCPTSAISNALVAFPRFIGLHQIIRVGVEKRLGLLDSDEESLGLHHVTESFFLIRGTVHLLLALQHLLPPQSAFVLDDNTHKILKQGDYFLHHDRTPNVPQSMATRTSNLPKALTCILSNDREVQVVDQATRVLSTSACHSWHADTLFAAANGIDSWPCLIPEDFVRMLESSHPAALIVFSHWCPLLCRFEAHYPFAKGHSERLIKIIRKSVGPELRPLLLDLEQVGTSSEVVTI